MLFVSFLPIQILSANIHRAPSIDSFSTKRDERRKCNGEPVYVRQSAVVYLN